MLAALMTVHVFGFVATEGQGRESNTDARYSSTWLSPVDVCRFANHHRRYQ